MSILAYISLIIVDSLVIVDNLPLTDESTITRGDCNCLIKVTKSMDFLVEVERTRSALCVLYNGTQSADSRSDHKFSMNSA